LEFELEISVSFEKHPVIDTIEI